MRGPHGPWGPEPHHKGYLERRTHTSPAQLGQYCHPGVSLQPFIRPASQWPHHCHSRSWGHEGGSGSEGAIRECPEIVANGGGPHPRPASPAVGGS